jgi:hypothetical protein
MCLQTEEKGEEVEEQVDVDEEQDDEEQDEEQVDVEEQGEEEQEEFEQDRETKRNLLTEFEFSREEWSRGFEGNEEEYDFHDGCFESEEEDEMVHNQLAGTGVELWNLFKDEFGKRRVTTKGVSRLAFDVHSRGLETDEVLAVYFTVGIKFASRRTRVQKNKIVEVKLDDAKEEVKLDDTKEEVHEEFVSKMKQLKASLSPKLWLKGVSPWRVRKSEQKQQPPSNSKRRRRAKKNKEKKEGEGVGGGKTPETARRQKRVGVELSPDYTAKRLCFVEELPSTKMLEDYIAATSASASCEPEASQEWQQPADAGTGGVVSEGQDAGDAGGSAND